MARIREVRIQNFRGIKFLSWRPKPGINCLIGPGDSGKTTILDAIDLCLGARRNVVFTDADFHDLNVDEPVIISLTIGDLEDKLNDIERYGMFLRGFDQTTGESVDEPGYGYETVITLQLRVSKDLEPVWELVSDRAREEGIERGLAWQERVRLTPTRIGASADYHLSWRRGSVVSGFFGDPGATTAGLAEVSRMAREAFGEFKTDEVSKVLLKVAETAQDLGVQVGDNLAARLDPHAISINTGAITLHDESRVPLRALGTGSMRLLIAGLQGSLASKSSILLVDEIEHGLEPHRIIRFLDSLGAKEIENPPLQVFMTSHSPTALRELSGEQLFVVRRTPTGTNVLPVGTQDHLQGTIREFPEAFLAPSVIVCEGKSEIGLLRGLDQYRTQQGRLSIGAKGVALVQVAGGDPTKAFSRAAALRELGYRVAVFVDADRQIDMTALEDFKAIDGTFFCWRDGRNLEDELFLSLSKGDVKRLLQLAIRFRGRELIDQHIKSRSMNGLDLDRVEELLDTPGDLGTDVLNVLARAANSKQSPWFKTIRYMEQVGREVVGPGLDTAEHGFKSIIENIFSWVEDSDV